MDVPSLEQINRMDADDLRMWVRRLRHANQLLLRSNRNLTLGIAARDRQIETLEHRAS